MIVLFTPFIVAVPVWFVSVGAVPPMAQPAPRLAAPTLQPPARSLEPDWPRALTRRT